MGNIEHSSITLLLELFYQWSCYTSMLMNWWSWKLNRTLLFSWIRDDLFGKLWTIHYQLLYSCILLGMPLEFTLNVIIIHKIYVTLSLEVIHKMYPLVIRIVIYLLVSHSVVVGVLFIGVMKYFSATLLILSRTRERN